MRWGRKFQTSVVAVFAGVIALGWFYLQFRGKNESEVTNTFIVTVIFGLFAANLTIDLVVKSVHEYFADREENAILARLNELPGNIANHADIVVFSDKNAGMTHCINAASKALVIRNNILRYGRTASSDPDDPVYKKWRAAKETSITSLKTVWREIVSTHLNPNDPQVTFSRRMNERVVESHYDWRSLDDRSCPMVQMTLFEFGASIPSEVIFGWEFPHAWQGPCILTRNPETVEYFKKYFDFHFDNIDSTNGMILNRNPRN
jgi:hypothetical protein